MRKSIGVVALIGTMSLMFWVGCTTGQLRRGVDVTDVGAALGSAAGLPRDIQGIVLSITDPLRQRIAEIEATQTEKRKLTLEEWLYILGLQGGVAGAAVTALNTYRNSTREKEKMKTEIAKSGANVR